MAKNRNITAPAGKAKKKLWIQIAGPKYMNEPYLGDTHVYSPEAVMDKTLKVNLMELTNDIKKQNVIIEFRVNEIKGAKAHADAISYEVLSASLRRIIRRRKDKIEDSFVCVSSDNKKIRFKTVIITQNNTSHSIVNRLRLAARDYFFLLAKKSTFPEILVNLVNNSLQRELKRRLNRIFRCKIVEVRKLSMDTRKKMNLISKITGNLPDDKPKPKKPEKTEGEAEPESADQRSVKPEEKAEDPKSKKQIPEGN